jgi:uncharacterized protein (TIRG00374 family)
MFTKKRILVIAKIALSVGLIYWLLQGADLETIWETVKSARVGALLVAFLMFYIGFCLIALRWQLLLKVEQIDARFLYLLKSINIAVLFNSLLPSTIGGDAYRMYDVWRLGGTKTKAIAVILIDRFLGMFALVTYGVIAALLVPEVRHAIPGLVLYLVAILVAMLACIWMVFGSGKGLLDWFMALELRVLSIPQRIIGKIIDALLLYQGRMDVLIRALLISFFVQLNVMTHFVVVAYALRIDVPPLAMFIIIPLATLVMLLPVSINGVGVREAVMVFFFSLYGISSESAIAFAWVWLGMLLAQGMVGGIVFMLKRNKPDLSKMDDLPERMT